CVAHRDETPDSHNWKRSSVTNRGSPWAILPSLARPAAVAAAQSRADTLGRTLLRATGRPYNRPSSSRFARPGRRRGAHTQMTETTVAGPQSTPRALFPGGARDLPGGRSGDPRQSANLISFSFGFPDPGTLPKQSVAAATTRALEADGEWALQYGKSTGAPCLVDALLAKLRREPGIVPPPPNPL